MTKTLFDLNIDNLEGILLALIPAALNVFIFFYIIFRLPQNPTSNTFALFVISLATWQVSDVFARMSGTAEAALLWNRLLIIGPLLISPAGIHFTLLFTEQTKTVRSFRFLFVLYFPAILFECLNCAGFAATKLKYQSVWGWEPESSGNVTIQLQGAWVAALAIGIFILLFLHAYQNRNNIQKSFPSLLIAIGFAIPTLQGTITQIIFPNFLGITPIPIASTFMSTFSIAVIFVLTKYKALSFSPKSVWSNIMENMNEGIIIVDNNEVIKYVNKKICLMFDHEEYELIGKVASDFFVIDQGAQKQMKERLAKRKENVSERYELRYLTKKGRQFWCEISGSPYKDQNGNIIGSIGIHSDITDRKNAEEILRQQQEQLLMIYNNTTNPMWLIDIEGENKFRYATINDAYLKQSGFVRTQVERKLMDDVLSVSSHEFIRGKYNEAIRSGSPIEFFEEAELPAGRKYGEIKLAPIKDVNGKVIKLLGVVNDITQRRADEEKIIANSHFIRSITDVLPTSLVYWTTDLICSFANKAALSLLDKKKEEVIGKHILELIDENSFALLHSYIKAVLKGEQQKFERTIKNANGKTRHFLVQYFPEFVNGKPNGFIASESDITNLKRSEDRIRNFATDLNRVLEDERANIAREIHDELGQQLVGIKFGLSFIKKKYEMDEEVGEKVNEMIKDVDNILQSMRKIATELRPGILDSLGLIPSIHWLVGQFEKKTGIICILDPQLDHRRFEKDISICFFRICQEALTNISKHSEASEVVVSIKQRAGKLIMMISDNGKGMSNEKLKDPFSSGLLGMRERAKIIGAYLKIDSKKDIGTIISVSTKINSDE